MLAVLRLQDDAYGMEVRREIEVRARRDASIGAVYATLDRLEAKGLVRSRELAPEGDKAVRAASMSSPPMAGAR